MKILASDLDGTLMIDQKISPKDLEGIQKLREQGHKFVVSTGRTINGMKEVFDNYDLECDYMVLNNGAVVLDGDGKKIISKTIDKDILIKIVEEFHDKEETLIYFDYGQAIGLINNPNVDIKNSEFLSFIPANVMEVSEVKDLNKDASIIGVFASDKSVERAEKIKERLYELLGDDLSMFRNQYFIDIMPKGCSKGNGLREVLRLENKELKDLYTVGDSLNDISMLEITENSYTFNRAEEIIKDIANNHIDFVHEIVDKII